jgi:hypothetical protein
MFSQRFSSKMVPAYLGKNYHLLSQEPGSIGFDFAGNISTLKHPSKQTFIERKRYGRLFTRATSTRSLSGQHSKPPSAGL